MWKKKLCMNTSVSFGLPVEEQIPMLAQAGFDGFFTGWTQDAPIETWASIAKETNMMYQSIHAPFGKVNHVWYEGDAEGDQEIEMLTHCLTDCARHEVPVMIAHTFIGFTEHTPTAVGIDRFGRLVRRAEELGVTIAFENTEGEEYLEALMNAFSGSKAAGFCWDSGHEMCYNHFQDMLGKYGDRLAATHLNDNLGIRNFSGEITWLDDLHLLPFDGVGNWDNAGARIKKCGFEGPLTFELGRTSKPGRHENDRYSRMELVDYLAEAYMRACRVAQKCL